MVSKISIVENISKLMSDLKHVRNIAIIAHVHHGKTTLTDTLLVKAGLISKTVSGEVLYTNYEEIEKERRMTIKSADISLGFDYKGSEYIINLIDTPGHVDFGGHVTRSMRAVDGVVLVVDPVEGVMPQTETVLRTALKEKAKPVLFVNKVDRLISELKLTPEQTQERLLALINDINNLINKFCPEEFKGKWGVSVQGGSVAFGSAYDRWAVSSYIMQKYKINFKQVFEYMAKGEEGLAKLQEMAPIDEATLAMIVEHLPSPYEAQRYRIPQIWKGDLESEDGKAMLNADAKAKTNVVIFGVVYDQHSGEVAVGRVFSGTVKKGTELYMSGLERTEKVQQVGVFMGPDRVAVDEVPAGNIAAIVGLKDVFIGGTASENHITPFEEIRHYSQPVVAKAIEAKDTKDTAKLIEALRELQKEDPTLKVEINPETGEHIMRGLGELHLEIIETKIRDEFKIPIETSPPIVVYRETIENKVQDIEGKTPNKHSRFFVNVEPLEKGVVDMIETGIIKEGKPKGKQYLEELVKAGMPREEARNIYDVSNNSMLINATHGVQYLNEVLENLIIGFEEAVGDGPLAREKCTGIKVLITDATIHEDPVHRGPAQIIPAMRRPIYAGMITAGVVLLEPKQILTINIPQEYMSDVISLIQKKRGQILEENGIVQEGEAVTMRAKMPVAEVIKGFSNEIRSVTTGRAIWYFEYAGYEKMPAELQAAVVKDIRKRKGLPEQPPSASEFMD